MLLTNSQERSEQAVTKLKVQLWCKQWVYCLSMVVICSLGVKFSPNLAHNSFSRSSNLYPGLVICSGNEGLPSAFCRYLCSVCHGEGTQ